MTRCYMLMGVAGPPENWQAVSGNCKQRLAGASHEVVLTQAWWRALITRIFCCCSKMVSLPYSHNTPGNCLMPLPAVTPKLADVLLHSPVQKQQGTLPYLLHSVNVGTSALILGWVGL